jgi:hypothetical protein
VRCARRGRPASRTSGSPTPPSAAATTTAASSGAAPPPAPPRHGATGTDELLGDGIIKRTHADGRVEYAREQGFGRTAWPGGLLTVNRTSLGGRAGTLLTLLGVGTWMGAINPPPDALTAAQEDELRRRAADTGSGDSGGSGDSSSDDDSGSAGDDDLASPGDDGGDLGGDDSDSDFG